VLVIDDAVVVRKMVTDVLAADPAIEVCGTAPNGRIGLAKLTQVNPDVVTLDVEMPEMDGLQALAALRKTHPRLPVIMFSTLTARGAAATLDALALGASDYVTKPANVGSVTAALDAIRAELIPKIKQFRPGGTPPPPPPPRRVPAAAAPAVRLNTPDAAVSAVVVAASTGGPNALTEVLAGLPADFPVPIMVAQHMPPVFTRLLAERLAAKSRLRAAEAEGGSRPAPGAVLLAPGDYHMLVARDARGPFVRLSQAPPENCVRPAADVLFRTAAQVYGPGTLAVVLTGMGQDGLRGCQAVRAAGGRVLAQDEPTSVVWGMPGFVTRAGLADDVLPLPRIAAEILRRAARPAFALAGRTP
jgi:two-component system chemotaxis response regulator CheB